MADNMDSREIIEGVSLDLELAITIITRPLDMAVTVSQRYKAAFREL